MNVLDLFSGLKGWSQAFADRGHRVVTVDIENKFEPSICADIRDLSAEDFRKYGQFDIVLASPPCNCFSIARVFDHWTKDRRPKDEATFDAIDLVAHAIRLILKLYPRWWILENPRGMLRHILGKPSKTTFFASWGHFAYKPTDLWGVLPEGIGWRKPKKWQKAPRGSNKGIAGLRGDRVKQCTENMGNVVRAPALRAKIPYGLSEAVCLACERSFNYT